MSKSRIEVKHSKPKMQHPSRRDTLNGANLEDLPRTDSMRSRSKQIDLYSHAVTTKYKRVERYLEANVGKPVSVVRSEFIRDILPGLGASVSASLRRVFDSSIINPQDEANNWILGVRIGQRSHTFIEDGHGILRKYVIEPRKSSARQQDLYPVLRREWAVKDMPEAWELRNGVWFRLSFYVDKYPVVTGFFNPFNRSIYYRTNNNMDFKHTGLGVASRTTCSKDEIRKRIMPRLNSLGVPAVDAALGESA